MVDLLIVLLTFGIVDTCLFVLLVILVSLVCFLFVKKKKCFYSSSNNVQEEETDDYHYYIKAGDIQLPVEGIRSLPSHNQPTSSCSRNDQYLEILGGDEPLYI